MTALPGDHPQTQEKYIDYSSAGTDNSMPGVDRLALMKDARQNVAERPFAGEGESNRNQVSAALPNLRITDGDSSAQPQADTRAPAQNDAAAAQAAPHTEAQAEAAPSGYTREQIVNLAGRALVSPNVAMADKLKAVSFLYESSQKGSDGWAHMTINDGGESREFGIAKAEVSPGVYLLQLAAKDEQGRSHPVLRAVERNGEIEQQRHPNGSFADYVGDWWSEHKPESTIAQSKDTVRESMAKVSSEGRGLVGKRTVGETDHSDSGDPPPLPPPQKNTDSRTNLPDDGAPLPPTETAYQVEDGRVGSANAMKSGGQQGLRDQRDQRDQREQRDQPPPASAGSSQPALTSERSTQPPATSDGPTPQVDVKSQGNGPFSLSLVNDMVPIPKSGAIPQAPQSKVYAGKNETQSVQLAISAAGGNLTNVQVSASDLIGGNGQKIDGKNVDLFREHYVQVTQSSYNSIQDKNAPNLPGPPGWYADGLLPLVDPHTGKAPTGARPGMEANGFSLQAGENQPIWADVKVPAGTAAGDYKTTITVKSDQGTQQIPLDVHVWNFEVPNKPFMQTSFNATGTNDANVQEQLLENKISPVVIDQNNAQKDLDMGLTAQSVGFYSGADYGHPVMGPPPSVSSIQAAKQRVNPTGSKDLEVYDYSADEIGGHTQLFPVIQQWAQNLHAAGVDNLITMAPQPGLLSDGTNSGKPAVDIFSMLPVQYESTPQSLMQNFKDKGAQMWSYNTLVQDKFSPKWLIDFPPLQERLQAGFISQSARLTGMLDWSVTNWSADPWNSPYKGFALPGEGALVLPGQAAGLQGDAPTIRLKALRDGINDYNYTQMLTRRGNGAVADQVAQSVGLNFKTWTRDPVAVEQAHEKLGYELERAQAKNP